jgi:glutathione S-transferase
MLTKVRNFRTFNVAFLLVYVNISEAVNIKETLMQTESFTLPQFPHRAPWLARTLSPSTTHSATLRISAGARHPRTRGKPGQSVSRRATGSGELAHHVHTIRLALNIKGIPYKTVWIEFFEIEAESKKVGAAPTGERGGKPLYTIPFLYDPATRTAVSDSQEIVAYLERQYPTRPTLFPPGTRALQAAFVGGDQSIIRRIADSSRPLIMPTILKSATEPGQAYARKAYGAFLEQMMALTEEFLQEKADDILKALGEVDGWMGAGAVFLTGETPSNADVWLAATLVSIRNALGEEHEFWKRIAAANGGRWARYMAAFDAQNWFTVL